MLSSHAIESRVGPFAFEGLSQRQVSILRRIASFFSEDVVNDILVPLINQSSIVSLRALDWLVTNYSKKRNIVCKAHNGALFNIYHGYKVALSHFRRRNFDPFRRRTRIWVFQGGLKVCDTTVGQCNFLHWAHKNGVLAYAIENARQIENDMNSASAQHKAERRMQRAAGVPHRRRELSVAPQSKCSVYQIETNVTFKSMFSSDSGDEGV